MQLEAGQYLDTIDVQHRTLGVNLSGSIRDLIHHVELLVKIFLEIEDLCGSPQDVEWAIKDGTIYILQSRPITTLGATGKIN